MDANKWKSALWVAVIAAGAVSAALWAADRGSGDARVSAAGLASGADADGAFSAGSANAEPDVSAPHARLTAAGEPGDWDVFSSGPAARRSSDGGNDNDTI